MLCAFSASAQFNNNTRTDIVRYNFNTYKGTPIKDGWLFDDITYKKLYASYTAADSLIAAFEEYKALAKKTDDLNLKLITTLEQRVVDKDSLINKQSNSLVSMNELLERSNKNVETLQDQFITIGKMKIHKGTAWKVGIPMFILGGLIGFVGGR